MRTLIDAMPAYIYAKDWQGRHLLGNAALAQLYGLNSPSELLGKTDFDFYARELAEQYQASELSILRDGTSLVAHEEPNIGVDGRQRWNSTTKVPLRNALGQIVGLVGITNDITERKRAEQQMEETLRETERLYAAISHESWQAYRQTGGLQEGYMFDRALIRPAESVWEPEVAQALDQRALVTSRSGQRPVAVTPLAVRGEVIGALGVYDDPAHPLGKDDLDLIEAVSEQVALALENARLFDQNQRDAEREHTLNRITNRIRSARSVDEVLTIATQELRLATRAARSVAEIAPRSENHAHAGNDKGLANDEVRQQEIVP
ncbi:MAG: PAS domain-containing protein [Chloroflexi bacterium]|nr:PAS domain-containing protein [Chloroflexota bacterium]